MGTRRKFLAGLSVGLIWPSGKPGATMLDEPKTANANARARIEAARQVYEILFAPHSRIEVYVEQLHLWSSRWMEAAREIGDRAEIAAVTKDHLERMKSLEKRLKESRAGEWRERQAAFYRLEAEKWLAEVKG